jgi:hypothetical protein
LENLESYQNSTIGVADHSSEEVGGIKSVEAMGGLKLLSAGFASLAAVDDLHLATGRDLNLVVGQKHNATVAGDMQERIQGLRQSVAVASQSYQAPKTWIGSEGVNALQVLADLIDLVGEMNAAIAGHMHGATPPPDNAAVFVVYQGKAEGLSINQKTITL